ncbi:MAG: DUF5723 family protein [Flavobacteriaceae bacterium]|nr:DUF5723 family protein [Flavobacteriaceae bacterium]
MLELPPLMINKLYLLILFAIFCVNVSSQNQQLLYGFDQLPQNLMLNPGAEVAFDKHFGIPFLSNVYFEAGATNNNITYNNILKDTDSNSEALRNVYGQDLKNDDYFLVSQQLELINAGWRLKNPDYYLSLGMYQKLEGFANYPVDFVELFYEGDDKDRDGIPEKDVVSTLNEVNVTGEMLGVFHVGLSKKVSEKLNIGVRLKFISASLNMHSANNSGSYFLRNLNAPFQHDFSNLNFRFDSSGFIDKEGNSIVNRSDITKGLFFLGGNFGLGLDVGFTYHASENVIFSASLLDLDYVNYSDAITTYEIVNDGFVLEDDNFYDPPDKGQLSYWENTIAPIYLKIDTLQTAYVNYRAPKLHTSAKYQINKKSKEKDNSVFRNTRYVTPSGLKTELISEIGIQTYTAFRPNKIDWAITGFYSKEITNYLTGKISYTYDDFSAKNIGIGFSTHFRKFNFYATADNLLALPKMKDSNYQSFQFGMNLIFY